MARRSRLFHVATMALVLTAGVESGCAGAPGTVLEQLIDARALAARLMTGMAKAGEASNRAVMAGTDESANTAASEARQALGGVDRDVVSLKATLDSLRYDQEGKLLIEFTGRFAEYRGLDDTILDLAVQNTNLKAQRLSFGPEQDAARSFARAVESVRPRRATDAWQVRAEAAMALAAVREIQVLQAPHIAEADDAAMTAMEQSMKRAETTVRRALATLAGLADAASAAELTKASTAFDQFMTHHAEIIRLSRANSNVQSLALSLGQTRRLLAACDESLQALERALNARRLGPSR